MRKSNVFFISVAIGLLLVVYSLLDSTIQRKTAEGALIKRASLVAELGLTDLSLFTEARYIRHLSQSDLHSAFQDHPFALEHFPSGSLLMPPERWLR